TFVMRPLLFDLLTLIHIPEGEITILGSGGDEIGIGTPLKVHDSFLMTPKRVKLIAGLRLPDLDAVISITGCEKDTIG
ncbi:hypothetical protein OAF87_01575, partial [Akkermansiaceae bacterium]|nr:hypothetical protein [Akkermansiaceae bacterium]